MLADIDFADAIADSDLNNSLSSYIVVISAISRNNEGFANILFFRECVENRLYEIFEVVLLLEDLDLLSEATGSWLLILIGGALNLFDA